MGKIIISPLGMKNLTEHVECHGKVNIWKRLHWAEEEARDPYWLTEQRRKAGEGQDHDAAVAPTAHLVTPTVLSSPDVGQTEPNVASEVLQ